MQPPRFWYPPRSSGAQSSRPGSFLAYTLTPLAAVYDFFGRRRIKKTEPAHASVPVICIGNLTVGGTGKTPTALAVADIITSWGLKPVFLIRGYGGTLHGPVQATSNHTPADIGDEACLLATHAPTIVSRNRPEGARLAASLGADVIIMDDGFQNPTLYKDFSIVVVDGDVMFGNGSVFPAGPLRERPAHGLARADAVLIIKDADDPTPPLPAPYSGQVVTAHIEAKPNPALNDKLIAFAGIGRPDKFFATLRNLNTNVIATHAFPDHHAYTEHQIDALLAEAETANARLITTTKDAAKLSSRHRTQISVLEIEIILDTDHHLRDTIRTLLDTFEMPTPAPQQPENEPTP